MPSTDSGGPEKVDAMPSERVVGMAQNEWTASIGIDGRHGPDYALVPILVTVKVIAAAKKHPRATSAMILYSL